MEDNRWPPPAAAAIERVVGKLRFFLGNSSESHKFKGTMKMLDLLEEKLKLLREENLQRVSIDREEEMSAWLRQVKEAADDAEDLVKDMEAELELETGEPVMSDVMTWFHSDSSFLLRMKYTIGRLVNVCNEGESIIGKLNMDEDSCETVQKKITSLFLGHAYVVGRDKEISMILEMILGEAHFKAATSLESWESADSLQISQKGWIIDTLRNVDLSMHREEDAEVVTCQKEAVSRVEYTQVCNDSEMWNPAVIPIVGMSGVGKTTLAQLIFNDKRILEHFQGQSAWVYFTDNIRKEQLMTQILISLQPQHKILADVFDLNSLHVELKNFIQGKRFFLVLDGVSDEVRALWSGLRSVLRKGAPGSVVLVTTQMYGVAKFMGTTTPIFLDPLKYDDLWKVFEHHAFGSNRSTEALEPIGRKIVDKLHGFPLAATMIGASLRNHSDEMLWIRFLKSWWWKVSSNSLGIHIVASLGVCYCELPAYLRQCLVYCSMFPRNYVFGKYELIQMWMANGFTELNDTPGSRSLDEVAAEWFNELVNRCFLQPTIWKARYVMHDLVRDFSIALASNEYCGVDCKLVDLSPSVRHLSLDMDSLNMSWADYNIKRLRSLMLFGGFRDINFKENYSTIDNVLEWSYDTGDSISETSYDTLDSISDISYDTIDSIYELSSDIVDMDYRDLILKRSCEIIGIILTTSTSLRLFNLSKMRTSAAESCTGDRLLGEDHIAMFVKFIAKHQMLQRLTHLRYLDFSYSGITELPDSLCSLCNLQVLGLRGCRFTQLPRNMSSLISLRHLHADVDTIALIHRIGALTKLQELHEFCVKAEDGHRITELMDMRYIQGSLCISDLQNVANQEEAAQADLFRKECVTCLYLKWDTNQSLRGKYNTYRKDLKQYDRGQNELLHARLIEKNYMPSDMSGLTVNPSELSTPDLAMEILGCLSPPWNLQKLKFFGYPGFSFPDWVGRLRYIQVIELRQCRELQVFPPIGQLEHLRKLKLNELPSIKNISSDVYGTSNVVFGSLEELSFESMVKWKIWADAGNRKLLPNLQNLQIKRCYNLKDLPSMAFGIAIKVLSLSACGSYADIVSSYLHRLSCLTNLEVTDCSQKFILPCQHLVSLEYLHLSNCKELCLEGGILCLKNLKKLHISSCHISTPSLDGEINHKLSDRAPTSRKDQTFSYNTRQLYEDVDKKGREIQCSGPLAAELTNESMTCLPWSPATGSTQEPGREKKKIDIHASIVGPHGTTRIIRESPQKDEGIHVMNSLTELTMDNLSLSLNPENIIPEFSVLRTLCLYKHHKISVVQEQLLEQFKSLQELEFSGCYFLRKLPSNLSTLSSLKRLSLQSCSRIHALPSKGLPGNLKELEILGCSPILQARCQKENGETRAKEKIGRWLKGATIQQQQEKLNEFWQGWLKCEKEWMQCGSEQLKSQGDWLKNEQEEWLENSAQELESNEDAWIKPTGEDWPKISHIPYIHVNGCVIQNLYL